MSSKGNVSPLPPKEIVSKIRPLLVELSEASENDGLTTPQLIELIHHQIRKLARVYHQLSRLQSGKEGDH